MNDLRQVQRGIETVLRGLERALAWDDAVGLAIKERTGREPEPGADYTAADEQRAREIMRQCWHNDTETF